METLLLDVRYALRVFRANPALFATAVLSLAIGIGPNSVLFSVIDAVGFRPLPIRDPGGLVIVRSSNVTGPESDSIIGTKGVAYPDYVEIRDRVGAFADVGASARAGFGMSGGSQAAEVVMGSAVTASYFPTFGVRASDRPDVLPGGRSHSRHTPGRHHRRAAMAPPFPRGPWCHRAIGSSQFHILHDRRRPACRIHGHGPNPAPEVWVPTMLYPALSGGPASMLEAKGGRDFTVFARLRDGVTIAQAGGEVAALGASLAERDPETHKDWRLVAEYEQAARRHRLGGSERSRSSRWT